MRKAEMTGRGRMLFGVGVLAFMCASLIALPAQARGRRHHNSDNNDRSGRHEERSRAQGSSWDWHPGMLGDPLGSWRDEYNSGITFGLGGDGWGLSYRDGNLRLRYREGGYGTYPNSYYGDGCYDGYGYSNRPRGRQHLNTRCYPPGYSYGYDYYGNVVVIGGSGGYDAYDYGYQDPLYVDGSPVYPGGGDVYYDNSVTNNYYGEAYVPAAPAPRQSPEPAPAQASVERAMGMRFFESTRLESSAGVFVCSIKDAKLMVGPENGPALTIASGIDTDSGAFAAWVPAEGLSVIYVREGNIYAAYDSGNGKWWSEALPARPQLSAGLSLGLISNEPWVSFSDSFGTRFVYTWRAHAWMEIGSASRS